MCNAFWCIIQAKVQQIHVDGLGRSKEDFVSGQVKGLFKATNFEEVSLVIASVFFDKFSLSWYIVNSQ